VPLAPLEPSSGAVGTTQQMLGRVQQRSIVRRPGIAMAPHPLHLQASSGEQRHERDPAVVPVTDEKPCGVTEHPPPCQRTDGERDRPREPLGHCGEGVVLSGDELHVAAAGPDALQQASVPTQCSSGISSWLSSTIDPPVVSSLVHHGAPGSPAQIG